MGAGREVAMEIVQPNIFQAGLGLDSLPEAVEANAVEPPARVVAPNN